jgi:hypothetical protein
MTDRGEVQLILINENLLTFTTLLRLQDEWERRGCRGEAEYALLFSPRSVGCGIWDQQPFGAYERPEMRIKSGNRRFYQWGVGEHNIHGSCSLTGPAEIGGREHQGRDESEELLWLSPQELEASIESR